MKKYILKRAFTGLIAVIFVFAFNFFLIRMAPGSPARILAGVEDPSPEMMEALNAKYGLDKPLHVQFTTYLKHILSGNLEDSIMYQEPVTKVIGEAMGPSLILTLTGALLAVFLGTTLGLYAARHQNSIMDKILSGTSFIFNSTPSFWLGLMLIMIFSTRLKLLPTSGMYDMRMGYTGFAHVLDVLRHLCLPLATMVLVQIPIYFKIAKSSVTQVLAEDFMTTFRAVGMSEKKIFNKYVFKNSLLPIITVFGINLAYIVTGSSLTEMVFGWPGMGRLLMDSIMRRDYPLLMAIYLILSLSIAIMMVVTDLIYACVDPRIRYNS